MKRKRLQKPEINHDAIIEDWKQNAEAHDEENYEFLHSMKHQRYGFEPDELAGELHQQAFHIIDCTQCANCCKTLDIEFNNEDINRISEHLEIEISEFIEKFLIYDEVNDCYNAGQKPCPFLDDNNLCTIYEVRPKVCREYPYTDKKGLTHRTMGVANNTLVCPAVFWIVEQMKQQALG